MDRSTMERFMGLLSLALAVGCAKDKVQPISGRVALQTFDRTVTAVRVVRPGAAPIVGRVSLDGTFEVKVPRGRHYHLEFTGPSGEPYLVFPRAAGSLGWTFDVRGRGAPFDVGTVRYLGDPLGKAYTFVTRQSQALSSADERTAEDDECEDGKSVKTGATCIDDDDDDKGKEECDDDDDQDADDCVNGTAPKTGAPCTPPSPPGMAAVADHNLPPVMGTCDDDDDDEGDDD